MNLIKKSLCLYIAFALSAPLDCLCIGRGYFFMEFKIYILTHPITEETKYVGQTQLSLKKRLKNHLCIRKEHFNSKKNKWILELKKDSLKPNIHLIDKCDSEKECLELESFWIRYLRFVGCNLTNGNNGGAGSFPSNLTEDGRKRLSKASLGRPSWSKGLKGIRKLSDKEKRNISIRQSGAGNSMYGKNHSQSLKSRYSKERAGSANYFYGKTHKKESLDKIKQESNRPERKKISAKNIKKYIKWIKLKSKHNQLYIKFPSSNKRKK